MSKLFFTNVRVEFDAQALTKEQFHSRLSDVRSFKFVIGVADNGDMRVLFDPFNDYYHSDIAKILRKNGYEVLGGGKIGVNLLTDKVEAQWDSNTLTSEIGYDRPKDPEVAQKLIEQICAS